MKRKILLTAICAAAFFGAGVGAALQTENVKAETATGTPTVSIYAQTLALEENIHIKYAVATENVSESDESGLLVWRESQETYEYGTQDTLITVSNETLEEEENAYPVYAFTELSAKEMVDTVYAVAYVEVGDEYYYSPVKKYSILEYAYNMLGETEAEGTDEESLKTLLNAMLTYGGAAQTYFGYKTETLASDKFSYVRIENATFADGFPYGLFEAGTDVIVTPDEGYELSATAAEYLTTNEAGEIVLTVPTEKTVDESSIYKPVDTTFLNAYNGTYGYEYFGSQENGEALQTLYNRIDKEVRAFHVDTTKDLTGDYTVATVAYADLGLTSYEAASVWKTYKDDNPVYYWMSNSISYTAETIILQTVEDYALGETRETYNQLVYDQVAAYKAKLNKNDNAYQVAFGYHDMIIEAIDYTYDENGEPSNEAWAHNVLGVLTKAGGVCEAYARTYQLLLNYSGVENIYVTGESKGIGHAWNLVRLDDGNWYWYDLTWDDEGELGYIVTKNMGIYRDYFCKYGANLSGHTVWSDVPTVEDGEFKFMYDLPVASTAAYTDNTGLLLGETLTTDDCNFTIVGYKALELNKTTKTGDVVIPETVAYEGADYTIVSLGSKNENRIGENMTSVSIPETVKFIWEMALNIYTLETISVDRNNKWFTEKDGVLFTKNLYTLIEYPAASTKTEYVIPDETVYVTYSAFITNSSLNGQDITSKYLHSLTIGKNVQKFGVTNWGGGYMICEPNKSVTMNVIGGNLERISLEFLIEDKLISVKNENIYFYQDEYGAIYQFANIIGVGSSYELAAFGNIDIKTYKIPKEINGISVSIIEEFSDIFSNCLQLESISVEDETEYYFIKDGVLYDKDLTKILVVPKGIKGTLEIPSGLINIGSETFYNCSDLTEVILPNSVKSIGNSAFSGCTSLKKIEFSEGVTDINYAAFKNCIGLTEVILPNSVKSIGGSAFSGCTSLKKIEFSEGVTSIGSGAFYGCSGLTSVIIPDNVKSIESTTFNGCCGLTSVTICGNVTSIGGWAFNNCSALKTVYYKGTAEDWASITIGSNNDSLQNATVYYYSENEPTADGNYWHYDTDGVTPVAWTKTEE